MLRASVFAVASAMTSTADLTVPAGFEKLVKPSPFLTMLGPVYARGLGPSMVMGFHVGHHHLNRRGILHGGVVASLADAALGYCLADPAGGDGKDGKDGKSDVIAMSTASLTVDFIASAGEGDWIEITPQGLRTGSRLAFAQALFHRGDRLVARASAVFAVLGARVAGPV
ncbi:PaaI family thioesterase [Ralstonia solanacearum]|uniref:PaaI family thioesterase n=1 Tax=Ralstonia solanacearum TaxID=305 RepID=UPI0005AC39C4|nr:PaaI family thioesterase [Ralstonia solanacearum]AMP69951.1 signal peptidase [Ralstonia solanacearum]MBB6587158.1 PaaI family thioesterase [Ralstonia solanacearum]MCL9840464.1 PaaI family thioesterase [Ralstonia solanacearum]MDB0532914.1 PaaI family thioesterase [Ralstonia solanacearum]MDB0537751.1 PaaI family thioesterase [Ralstonia solanacearum]